MKVPRGLYVSFLITSEKFTLNDQGSLEGWASTPEEALRRLPLTTSIKNLYLTGHWAMPGGGINLVTRSGLMAADLLIKDEIGS